MSKGIRIGVLGASGYTGADLVRLALAHPSMEIAALTANSQAGKPMAEVFPQFAFVDLPGLTTVEEADWSSIDAVFCGLPHGTTQEIARTVLTDHPGIKFIDMSADFRLRDPAVYKTWYGHEHLAMDLQAEAVYGLTEHYRTAIRDARLVACPGCYPTAALLSLLPLVAAGLVDASDIVIDAKSGVTGAGRTLKQNILFSEAGEGLSPYSVGKHRHAPEIEQEISKVGGRGRHRQFHAASHPDEPGRTLHVLSPHDRFGHRRRPAGGASSMPIATSPSSMSRRPVSCRRRRTSADRTTARSASSPIASPAAPSSSR